MKFILGLKLEMSQIFDEKGKVIPITLIETGPCYITQIRTKEKDGYEAIQIGFKKLKAKKIKKPQKEKPFRYLREFKEDISKYKIGQEIDVSSFQEGGKVSVSGLSKGKGFAGVVKRWHFAGGPASHGVKHELRTPGSIGSRWPQRVIKGKKMPGRMGYRRITVKNLEIIKIDKEKNLMAVKGAIPGRRGTLLEIRSGS
ncbi:50S ribosomal protein L3 [Patescibacteria group bacterium]|nr:50S ribosomal protein L3 [Patescibacteria group bacterium]